MPAVRRRALATSDADMPDSDSLSRPPLILMANDQEWSARSLESILGPSGYAVVRAYTGRQALDLARSVQPDILIIDARLPDLSGIEVCALLRADPCVGAGVPIVVTTSDSAERTPALEAYRAGAWEFLRQPFDAEVLLLKLGAFLSAKREADGVREASLLDRSTGLYNLRGLAYRAREIGAQASRQHAALACVAFATETEPVPNDPRATDDVAREVAEHLAAVCRRSGRVSDAIGRLGHTEFAIVAPATEAAGAVRLVERLQRELAASPLHAGGRERSIHLRAGYCAVDDYAESSVDAEEMLLRAASALRHLRGERGGEDGIRPFEQRSPLPAVR